MVIGRANSETYDPSTSCLESARDADWFFLKPNLPGDDDSGHTDCIHDPFQHNWFNDIYPPQTPGLEDVLKEKFTTIIFDLGVVEWVVDKTLDKIEHGIFQRRWGRDGYLQVVPIGGASIEYKPKKEGQPILPYQFLKSGGSMFVSAFEGFGFQNVYRGNVCEQVELLKSLLYAPSATIGLIEVLLKEENSAPPLLGCGAKGNIIKHSGNCYANFWEISKPFSLPDGTLTDGDEGGESASFPGAAAVDGGGASASTSSGGGGSGSGSGRVPTD